MLPKCFKVRIWGKKMLDNSSLIKLGSAHHLYFDSQDKVTKNTTELEKICNDSLSDTQSHLFLELHITKLYS